MGDNNELHATCNMHEHRTMVLVEDNIDETTTSRQTLTTIWEDDDQNTRCQQSI